jgi:hypothetical protein
MCKLSQSINARLLRCCWLTGFLLRTLVRVVERDRDSHGQITLEAFEEASKQVPHGFRKTFLEDPNAAGRPANLGFWSSDGTEEGKNEGDKNEGGTHEEDIVRSVYDHMDTEEYFLGNAERMMSKVNHMQEEMQFLREDLSGVISDFGILVKHLQKSGVKGAEHFEESPREDPETWYESRKKRRKDLIARKRIATEREQREQREHVHKKRTIAERARGMFSSTSQQPEVSDL